MSHLSYATWLKIQDGPKKSYTIRCNLLLIACFLTIVISQGSMATYARRDAIFNHHFTANLRRNLSVKNCKSVKMWQNRGHEFLASLFWPSARGAVRWGRGGREGTAPPHFFRQGDASPTPPLFGLKFVQKLVHCCNWLLTETQCKIIFV